MEALSALAAATSASPVGASVTEVAGALGRDRSQVSRTLAALSTHGLAERAHSNYRVSTQPYASAQALTEFRLRTDGLTVLERLSSRVQTPCFLGELNGDSTVTIAESIPGNSGLIASWVGRAYPAFCSDAGQATLWDADPSEVRAVFAQTDFSTGGPRAARNTEDFIERLTTARARGYSIVDEEAEPGLLSVAAPVFDYRSENVAALQIVGTRAALASRIAELGAHVRAEANALTLLLGGSAT